MRYRENREQTAELLRMVLPIMSRHAAGFHPLSYAVWYEYVSGTNQALKSDIDALLAKGHKLSDSDIQELFDRHVAMRDIESSMRLRARIQKVVAEVTQATSLASGEVGRYNDGLGAYQDRMQRDTRHEAIAELVHGLMDDTSKVLSTTGELQQNLQHSAQEAERVGSELESVAGQAQIDPLTGLLNRRGLEQRAGSAHLRGLPVGSMLSIEVKQFNQLVENYGNLMGDRVLATVAAQLLSLASTEGALVARDRSNGFVLWLPGATPEAAGVIAERIRREVASCRIRQGEAGPAIESMAVAIGIATVAEGETPGAAVGRAVEAPRS